MKKTAFMSALLAISLLCSTNFATAAEKSVTKDIKTPPPTCHERPKLYDKNGNELKTPPKPGEKVYNKNGKELPPLKFKHHPPKGPDLNLTEEQKAKADKIREASMKKLEPLRKQRHEIKKQLKAIKENTSLTEEQKKAKAEPLLKKKKALHEQADKIRQNDMAQFEKILTPEQKKTLDEFKKTHKPPKHHHEGRPPMPERD